MLEVEEGDCGVGVGGQGVEEAEEMRGRVQGMRRGKGV